MWWSALVAASLVAWKFPISFSVIFAWTLYTLLARFGMSGFYTIVDVCIHALIGPRVPSPGYCVNCEYNLTGNESGVCPECGTKI